MKRLGTSRACAMLALALLLIAWVTGSGKIGELFDVVFNNIIGKAR